MNDGILNLALLRMAQGYEGQMALYEKIYELALEQSACLNKEEADTPRLLALIEQRQELIDALENANAETSSLKEEICETLKLDRFNLERIKKEAPGTGARSLEKAFLMLSGQLARIRELDKSNTVNLERHLRAVSRQMAKLQKTKRAQKMYRSRASEGGGILVDYSE